MSLARKAARGALWTVISSIGGRAVGVLGTLVMTRFLGTKEIGEVADAVVLVMSANWITIWGFGQYAVVKGRGADAAEVTWHATVAYFVLGAISLGAMALFGGRLVSYFGAPDAAGYIPWLCLAFFLQRMKAIPERVLTRNMNFRASGLALMFGEMVYTIAAVGFALLGMGGMAIVMANIVQAVVVLAIILGASGIASWATPTPLRMARIKDMLKFGVPLALQNVAHQASRFWDRPMISYYLGTGAVGVYNMAYNLADIPAIQVGEQIALVLMPSMAELPRERRAEALERSSALLSLIIFPLAVGLGLISYPLISLLLPHNDWQDVAPLLSVLACLSVFRPITWVISAYLEAESKTNRLMLLELAKLALLLILIAVLQPFGLRAAAAAVGIAFGLTSVAAVAMVVREGPSTRRILVGFFQPFVACCVMALAVFASYQLLDLLGVEHVAVQLVVMIAVGSVAYVVAALIIARESSRDLLHLLKKALKRGD